MYGLLECTVRCHGDDAHHATAAAIKDLCLQRLVRLYDDIVLAAACAWAETPATPTRVCVVVCAPRANGMVMCAEYVGAVARSGDDSTMFQLMSDPCAIYTWFAGPARLWIVPGSRVCDPPAPVWDAMWRAFDATRTHEAQDS